MTHSDAVASVSKTSVERTASPRRKQATAWSGGAELFGRGDPRERAEGDDTDAVASGPDRRRDLGGPGTPTLRALILSHSSALEWYAPARGSAGSGRQCRPQNGRTLKSF